MGFLGGAALLTAAVAVSKLLGALYKIPLGNLLGSRGMGCFQAAYNVYGVLLTLSTAGLPLAMSRLIAQSRGRPRRQRRIFHVALALFLALGLVAFVFDTIGGVLVAKVYNLFAKQKINPMIGAAGISAFPMSARVVNKMGLQEDNQNFLLMHAVGVNVSGQIASVIAGGMILTLFA